MSRPNCRRCLAGLSASVFAALFSSLAGCASENLGHGYRLVHVTVVNRPGSFEGLAHYVDLYHGLRKLGRVGAQDISPSGNYAAFEDNGRLLLFDNRSNRIREITDGEFAIPSNFDWDESAGILEIKYYDGHAPSQIHLSDRARASHP